MHKSPGDFGREMRLAAAVKWYELRRVSQGRAAEIAGLSRAEFIDALSRYGVSPAQTDLDDLVSEAAGGRGRSPDPTRWDLARLGAHKDEDRELASAGLDEWAHALEQEDER